MSSFRSGDWPPPPRKLPSSVCTAEIRGREVLSSRNAAQLVLGALASYAGFSAGGYGRFALLYAKVFGIVYIVLGLVGFVLPDVIPGVIHLDIGCNVVHLVLGLWGIWAGYLTAEARQAVASA